MNRRIRKILQSGIKQGLYTAVSFGSASKSKGLFYPPSLVSLGGVRSKNPKLFDTASVTKLFLTMLAYRLMTIRSQLALRESNRQRAARIAGFHVDALVGDLISISGNHTEKLRVRHLLNFHAEFNRFASPTEIIKSGDVRIMLSEIRSVGLAADPGNEFRYANVHPILLGVVLEEVFGSTLEELMLDHICKPLGLADTTSRPLAAPGTFDRVVKAGFCPLSKAELRPGIVSDPVSRLALDQGLLLGSSGLFSSVNDILTLLGLVLNNGRLHYREWIQFIDPELMRFLSQSETEKGDYAMGMGLWKNFRSGLERFNPTSVRDGLFKSGYSGVMAFVSLQIGRAFACQTNFLHKLRSIEELKFDRKRLNEIYASLAEVVIQDGYDDNKISECFS